MHPLLQAWLWPLVALTIGLPLLCALFLLVSGSVSRPRILMLLCALSQLAAGAAIAIQPDATLRSIPLGHSLLSLRFDHTAGFWLLLSGGLLGMFTFCGIVDVARHRQILILLAIAANAAAAVQDDLLWLLMLVSCVGWLCIAALAETENPKQGYSVNRWQDLSIWCGLFFVADLAAIGGLQWLLPSLPELSLSRLFASGIWPHLAEREPSLLSSASTLLWGMLVVRLGIYPAISWLKAATRTTPAALVLTTLIWPANLLLWYRLLPVLLLAPETRLMITGLSAFSLVLLGFLACFLPQATDASQHTRRCLLYVAAGLNAVVCLGSVAGGAGQPNAVLFSVLVASISPAVLLLAQNRPASSLVAALSGTATAGFMTTMGWCFTIALEPSELPSLNHVLGLLTGFGLLLLWYGFVTSIPRHAGLPEQVFRYSFAGSYAAIALFCIQVLHLPRSVVYVAMLFLIGWLLVERLLPKLQFPSEQEQPQFSSLVRLAEREFYLNDILEHGIAYPVWCLKLVLAFLADGLFLRAIPYMTQTLESSTRDALEEFDSPSMRSMHWEIVLMTTLVLGLAVWVMH